MCPQLLEQPSRSSEHLDPVFAGARYSGKERHGRLPTLMSGGAAGPERDSALAVLTGLGVCSWGGSGGGGGEEGAGREEQGEWTTPELGGRVITHPGLSGKFQILALKVPYSRRPLRSEQTGMAGHPTC